MGLEDVVEAAVEKQRFSGVIDIRQGDGVLYVRAAGYADRSNRIANTLETRFAIASGTKFLTALAIGKLIESGDLSFSTKLTDCLAMDSPCFSPDITIRQLLTHTSGIPDYYDEEEVTDCDDFAVAIPWHQLKGPRDYLPLFPDTEMKFRPGERFAYSNGGYILLGVVIEELSGMKYREFVEQSIFKPIGACRSGFFALNKLPEQTALGYIEEGACWRTNVYNLPIVGASDGGAFTTVEDMATLWSAFWGNEILSAEMVETFSTPYVRTGPDGERKHYGHGLWIEELGDGQTELSISGRDAGVSFKSSVNRARKLQVTVISNTTHGAWPILRAIEGALRLDV